MYTLVMRHKHVFILLFFLLLSVASNAQVNIYLGGNLQGLYSGVRTEQSTYKPGFGAGVSFYYWEFEYWFFKAGFDYTLRSSLITDYPVDFFEGIEDFPVMVDILYKQQDLSIPLTVYFSVLEDRGNALLLAGILEIGYTTHIPQQNDLLGEIKLTGSHIKNPLKTSVGVGIGYQRQLDRNIFINAVPSFNIELRAPKPFNTIKLTVEVMFGVY